MEDKKRRRITGEQRAILQDKDIYELIFIDDKTGATIEKHITHDSPDAQKNVDFAKLLTKKGISIRLLPEGNSPPGRTWPDMERIDNNEIIELKKTTTKSFDRLYENIKKGWDQIKQSTRDATKCSVAIDLSNLPFSDEQNLIDKSFNLLTKLNGIWVIRGNKITYYPR